MRKNIFFLSLCLTALLFFCSRGSCQPGNLLLNPEFKSADNNIPNHWKWWQDKSVVRIIAGDETNIVEFAEDTEKYVPGIFQVVEIDGFKTYELSVDVKVENIYKTAAMYYYWLDKDGKQLCEAHYVGQITGTRDWQTLRKVISPDDPVATKGLKTVLAVYGTKGGTGKAWFKKPVLKESGGEAKKMAQPEAAAVSEKTKKVIAGKTFLQRSGLHGNLTWKEQGQPYFIERGTAGYLAFHTTDRMPSRSVVTVDAPKDVEIEIYLYNISKGQCVFLEPRRIETKEGRHQIIIDVPEGTNWWAWGNSIFLRANEAAPEEFSINILISSPEGKILGDLSVPVRVLPPVKDMRLPSNFPLYTWYSYPLNRIDWRATSGSLPRAMLENWKAAGFSGGQRLPHAKEIQWRTIRDFTLLFSYYPEALKSINPDYSGKYPPFAVTAGNLPWKQYFCSSAMGDMGEEIYRKNIERSSPDDISDPEVWAVVDYEPYASIEGWVTKTCFCPVCLERFSRFAGIDKDNLNPRTILLNYQEKWIQFRCLQRSREVAAMEKAFHSVNPRGKFLLTSMPMPGQDEDDFFKIYGIDLRLYDSFVDIHYPMCYTQTMQFFHRMERNIRELKKPVIPVLGSYKQLMTPGRTGIQTLACAMLGSKGVSYWQGLMMMDGAIMVSIKQAMKKLAAADDYLLNGKLDQERVYVNLGFGAGGNLYNVSRSLGEKTAVLLVNNNESSHCYAHISVPGCAEGNYYIARFSDGGLFSPDGKRRVFMGKELRQGFAVSVEPLSDVFFEIVPGDAPASARIAYNTAAIATEEAGRQKLFASRMKTHSRNGMKAWLEKIGGKNYYAIETPVHRLFVDLGNSGTARWERKDGARWVSIGSAVGNDVFVAPVNNWLCDKDIDLLEVVIRQDEVLARFSYVVADAPFSGLVLEKTYTLKRNVPVINVDVRVIPEGGYRPFTYRAHNIIDVGLEKVEVTGKPYAESVEYLIPVDGSVIRDGAPVRAAAYVRPGAVFPADEPFMVEHLGQQPVKSFSGGWCTLRNTMTGEMVKATFGDNVDELFLWREGSCVTIEWIYQSAYPDEDPHKVDTWTMKYRLEYTAG